jgi:DNA polymerase III subunit chi
LPEVLFYHLERNSLEQVLPTLLARSLERGWRVVLQVGSDERLEALNAHLWTYDDASFLPHGSAADGRADEHPVWLTTGDDNPNGASVRFLVDSAESAAFAEYQRVVLIFDGADADSVARARSAWRVARSSSLTATYWRQDENGRWAKQAES